MPVRKFCARVGCHNLIPLGERYCSEHKQEQPHYTYATKKERAEYEPREVAFYASKQWRHLSKAFRYSHPLCAECLKQGRATPGRLVDHIHPIKTAYGWEHRLDEKNCQSLCYRCHAIKTSKEIAERGGRQQHKRREN